MNCMSNKQQKFTFHTPRVQIKVLADGVSNKGQPVNNELSGEGHFQKYRQMSLCLYTAPKFTKQQ